MHIHLLLTKLHIFPFSVSFCCGVVFFLGCCLLGHVQVAGSHLLSGRLHFHAACWVTFNLHVAYIWVFHAACSFMAHIQTSLHFGDFVLLVLSYCLLGSIGALLLGSCLLALCHISLFHVVLDIFPECWLWGCLVLWMLLAKSHWSPFASIMLTMYVALCLYCGE